MTVNRLTNTSEDESNNSSSLPSTKPKLEQTAFHFLTRKNISRREAQRLLSHLQSRNLKILAINIKLRAGE